MINSTVEIRTLADLENRLSELKDQSGRARTGAVAAFAEFKETIKPLNLVKQIFSAVSRGGDHNKLINASISLGAGALGKKIMFGSKKGFFNTLLSSGVQIFLSRLLSRNKYFNALVTSRDTLLERLGQSNLRKAIVIPPTKKELPFKI